MVHDITERIKAEKALNESEKKYRNIIEIANEGIMIADPSGRINFVNAKMTEMLGYSSKELLGTNAKYFVIKMTMNLACKKLKTGRKEFKNRMKLNLSVKMVRYYGV